MPRLDVFKQKFKRNGKTQESSNWYVSFKCHRGTWRRMPAFVDKALSIELKRKIERLVSLRLMGEMLPAELVKWFQALPKEMRERIAAFDLVDSRSVAAGIPLLQHVDQFHADQRDKELSPDYIDLAKARLQKLFDGCKFTYYGDINAREVTQWLAERRKPVETDDGTKAGISYQTSNFYLKALKQFCRWMIKHKRAADSPVEFLETLNVQLDRRHDRRALSEAELTALLTTTAKGPRRHRIVGVARAMLYRVAMETGLRRKELASLTPASINYTVPAIDLQARDAKNRRRAAQVIRCELADELKRWIQAAGIASDAPLWPRLTKHTAKMIRKDVEAAGMAYRDASGLYADFHCLRHSFVTMVTKGNSNVKVAQNLARHSSAELTIGRYSHTLQAEDAAGLDALPCLPSVTTPEVLTRGLTRTGYNSGQSVSQADSEAESEAKQAVDASA